MSRTPSRARRSRLHPLRNVLAVFGALAVTAATLVVAQPTPAAAVPATIPLKITNNSGRGDPVYIYNLGTNLAPASRAGPTPTARSTPGRPAATPRARARTRRSPARPTGSRRTIRMPKFSGRVYFSYGQKLVFKLTTRRPGAARRAEPERPEPEHPVQLVGVHAQRLRPVDQQHPGRHVLRAVPVGPALAERRAAATPASSSPAATTSSRRSARPARRLGQPGPDRTRRLRAARALPAATASRRAQVAANVMDDYVNRVWTQVRQRDADGHAVRRPAGHEVLRHASRATS